MAADTGTCQHCGYKVGLLAAQDEERERGSSMYAIMYVTPGRPGGLVGRHDCLKPHAKPHKVSSRICPGSLCPPLEAKA